jgi:hypothetical protein
MKNSPFMKITRKYLLLALLFVVYVCMSIFIPSNLRFSYDFLIPWYAALYIVRGVPLYEQPEYKFIEGEMIRYPYHMPIYIYFLAVLIWLFGENLIAGKISLVIFVFCDAILLEKIILNHLETKEKKSRLWSYTSLIFLLNPFILVTTITGLFDSLPFLYLLIGVFLLQKVMKTEKRVGSVVLSFFAGISIGIGFLTKVIPIIFVAVGFLWLFSKKKYIESFIFAIAATALSGGMIAYLLIMYPSFKYMGLGWQIERGSISYSLHYYLFDLEFRHDAILVGIGMFLIIVLTAIELIRKKPISLFTITGIFLTLFFILYRVFYPHYLFWLIPWLSYLGVIFINSKKMKQLWILLSIFFVQCLATILYYLDFFTFFAIQRTVLFAGAAVNFFCLVGYLVLQTINRNDLSVPGELQAQT